MQTIFMRHHQFAPKKPFGLKFLLQINKDIEPRPHHSAIPSTPHSTSSEPLERTRRSSRDYWSTKARKKKAKNPQKVGPKKRRCSQYQADQVPHYHLRTFPTANGMEQAKLQHTAKRWNLRELQLVDPKKHWDSLWLQNSLNLFEIRSEKIQHHLRSFCCVVYFHLERLQKSIQQKHHQSSKS